MSSVPQERFQYQPSFSADTDTDISNQVLVGPGDGPDESRDGSISTEQLNSVTASSVGPIRLPGTYPPEWLPDHETESCMSCDSPFTLIKRRHHCRSCGKIFCSECCHQRVKLLYLDNKEARVCSRCREDISSTLQGLDTSNLDRPPLAECPLQPTSLPSNQDEQSGQSNTAPKIQGVLKTSSRANECNTSSSSTSSDQQLNKQVMFADGIRPGTDLSESFPYPVPSSSSSGSSSFSILTRQNRDSDRASSSKRDRPRKNYDPSKNITVCDSAGYLPPIMVAKDSSIAKSHDLNSSSTISLANLISNQFKALTERRGGPSGVESHVNTLNGVMKFEEIADLVGVDGVVKFMLLKDFHLMAKSVKKDCCLTSTSSTDPDHSSDAPDQEAQRKYQGTNEYWSFASDGLSRYGQNEVVMVLHKDLGDPLPRDVLKIYLTLHELALRRQSIENLGNLIFQDGLFGHRDTVGLVFIQPLEEHCLCNLVIPTRPFLVALVLQRWEVPWSKVFPMRLLLGLGYKLDIYPYPLVSFKTRNPVYYEVGHTIISILGDFRNFRYSIAHVDGLRVTLNKKTRKVFVKLDQSSYRQFNKVLDTSNNEHVLAWSCGPCLDADGHLIAVQNEEGQHETVEFRKSIRESNSEMDDDDVTMGATFIIFSGALKVNHSGHSAKISIVEDGLLIQIKSCTMSALRNAIHFMHNFEIDCDNQNDTLNRMELTWNLDNV